MHPEEIRLLLNKLLTESTKVRVWLRSSESPDADWFFSVLGRLERADDGLLELTPSDADDPMDKLSFKESTLIACARSFTQPEDFSKTPLAETRFADPDSFVLTMAFDLPGGIKLALMGMQY
jgi:hypothetical protein